ncbi:EamA family transporter [Sodalis sp. RH21]|uniref:EamA family transporter n=1 Tax=unclassified Sodalis (in: enterobacteria) TaxID=2636512 RepID=UPI0039B6DB33
MDVAMGLLAAVLWGGTDVLIGINARQAGIRRAVWYAQLIGFIFISAMLACLPSLWDRAGQAAPVTWVLAMLAASLTVIGALCLSRAFATGKTAAIAPLVTSYGAVTAWLNWLSGERLSGIMLAGLLLCIMGVMMSSAARPKKESGVYAKSAPYFAVAAAGLYGISFWLQGRYTLPGLGPIMMLWVGYGVGLGILSTLSLRVAAPVFIPSVTQGLLLLAASLLNLGGFAAFALGAARGSVSIVTVLSTLSGGVAALLGAALLKERLSAVQLTGVLLVMGGAVCLHL